MKPSRPLQHINREIIMRRLFEFEMGLGRGQRSTQGRRGRGGEHCHARGNGEHSGRGRNRDERDHYSSRGHGMSDLHHRGDDRFGMGGCGHGGRQGGRHGAGRGGQRFGGARRISAEELQLLVLALLTEKPLHGYQIIKELDERSHGFYKPSPGMIYPLLSFLEESDLAEVELEGTKKLLLLTEAGRNQFKENEAKANSLLQWLEAQGQLINAMENAYEVERKSAESPLRSKVKEIRMLLHDQKISEEKERAIGLILDAAIEKIKAL